MPPADMDFSVFGGLINTTPQNGSEALVRASVPAAGQFCRRGARTHDRVVAKKRARLERSIFCVAAGGELHAPKKVFLRLAPNTTDLIGCALERSPFSTRRSLETVLLSGRVLEACILKL